MHSDASHLRDLLAFAIQRRVRMAATYNKAEAVLAPHSLFERHGDLFVRAVTLEYDGRSPREPKLGTFKLAGLSSVRLLGRGFADDVFAAFRPGLNAPRRKRVSTMPQHG